MDDLMGKIQDVLSDEESMNQIKQLAQMLGMDPDADNSSSPSGSQGSANSGSASSQGKSAGFDFDVNKIMALKGVIEQANKNDPSIDFLLALRPLLKDETQEKADKLIKIFRILAIWPVLKDSGLLGGDLFGLL